MGKPSNRMISNMVTDSFGRPKGSQIVENTWIMTQLVTTYNDSFLKTSFWLHSFKNLLNFILLCFHTSTVYLQYFKNWFSLSNFLRIFCRGDHVIIRLFCKYKQFIKTDKWTTSALFIGGFFVFGWVLEWWYFSIS